MNKVFFIVFVGMTVLGVSIGVYLKMHTRAKIDEVRIAYTIAALDESSLDPASIEMIDQALLIDNIYSHLVQCDDEGNIQAGIAKKFYWEGDTLVFEFDKKVKSVDGHYIDAQDAAISIRRVLSLGTTTHSDLSFFLCRSSQNKDPFSDCEAVRVENQKLYLKVKDLRYKPFLLTSLTSDDFVIIPKSVIDPKTLKILNTRVTSGPYYIDSINGTNWILKANVGHYDLTEKSPKKVTLVSTEGTTATDLFLQDRVDLLSTLNNIPQEKFDEIKSKIDDVVLTKTLGIKLYYLQFSPISQKKTTKEDRAFLAKKFRKLMKAKYSLPIFAEETNRFFLDQSFGKLSSSQEHDLSKYLDSGMSYQAKEKVSFYFYNSLEKLFKVFREIEEIDPVETDEYPFSQPIEKRLDLFLATTDTAYEESMSLLGYNFTQGTFGLDRTQGNVWLQKYLGLQEASERATLLQELQFTALSEGILFPLFKTPYTSIGRNGFSMKLSPLYASSHFWKIERR